MENKAGEFKLGFGEDGIALSERVALPEEKFFEVIVEEGDEQELNYIPVSVNGVVFQIMRGMKVVLPESYLEVLNNAMATKTVSDLDASGKAIKSIRNYNRIPYRVLREVPRPEKKAVKVAA